MIPTKLERAALDLLVELEAAVELNYAFTSKIILSMSRLRDAANHEDYDELNRIYRFAKLASEDKLIVSADSGKPRFELINTKKEN